MQVNDIGLPLVLTQEGDKWCDTHFNNEWDQVVRTWMPTQVQLESLDDDTIWAWATQRRLDLRDEVFGLDLRRRNLFGFEHGRRMGFWKGWTNSGPWQPKKVVASEFEGKSMAHVMTELGLFASVSQARKNGWDKPVATGMFKVGKNWVEIV